VSLLIFPSIECDVTSVFLDISLSLSLHGVRLNHTFHCDCISSHMVRPHREQSYRSAGAGVSLGMRRFCNSRYSLPVLLLAVLVVAFCSLCNAALSPGTPLYTFNNGAMFPQSLSVDAAGYLYVADYINGAIQVFSPMSAGGPSPGRLLFTFTASAPALRWPVSVAVDAQGNIYVGDAGNERIVILAGITSITPGAVLASWYSNGQITFPDGLTLDSAG
jgi:hypothetical protein